jgi:NTF2 fold immunity protein
LSQAINPGSAGSNWDLLTWMHMKFLIAFLIFPCLCYSQQKTDSSRLSRDEMYAQKEVADALLKPGICFFNDTLLSDKEMAIKYAEVILFKVYGEEQIISEKPYNIYKSHGFWYIDGTLPEGYKGGTFEIIFNSVNGQIIRLCHGK